MDTNARIECLRNTRLYRIVRCTAVCFAAVLITACGGGGSSSAPTTSSNPPPGDVVDSTAYGYSATDSLPASGINENTSVVSHQLTFSSNSQTIQYTSTTGHLTALDSNGSPEASIFYVAYLAQGINPATRPLTFLYNGGPGSSSIWLKLGAWAPSRVDTPDPATTGWPNFPLIDNQQSLIDTTDLVFIDPPGTGFSEAVAPYTNQSFWGVDADATVMRDFIERYLAVNPHGSAPLYLYGESYGTTRTDVLVPLLELAGVHLTGIVLHSCALDYNDFAFTSTDTQRSSDYVAALFPSFAEVADYFGDLTPAAANPGSLAAQMRSFVDTNYAELAPFGPTFSGIAATPVYPTQSQYDTLSSQTGLSDSALTAYLGSGDFYDDLVSGSVIGEYDGRVVVPNGSPLLVNDPDPSDALVSPFVTTFSDEYLPDTLGYVASNTSYEATNNDTINTWNFDHDNQPYPDTIPDLLEALTLNPDLQVLVINGYHDLVTPFFETEKDLARLQSVAGLQANIQVTHYTGGHMTYLDDNTHPLIKADLASFYAGQTIAGAMTLADLTAPWADVPPATSAPGSGTGNASTRRRRRPAGVDGPFVPSSQPSMTAMPAASGSALQAAAFAKLQKAFNAADTAGSGRLTAAQARQGGLVYIADRFVAIDTANRGSVSFDDVRHYLQGQPR